ncbi:hypothetical protein BDBG_16320 [Blastomyces gilchristii SLH14081]|uniref:Uncharacterized protein n=1 Tax=Blastomyces gilchristii (strain SLH14081) TaxID=559298 RepID=A0A179UA22_BLAGS|nr:uncharacterized protein BDBG_16320 [Blastomyces gilchristii SLH14081]OAT04700.1 hypothetical protein BDBG_16320 [Blastomyces gilchristii SLH14081]
MPTSFAIRGSAAMRMPEPMVLRKLTPAKVMMTITAFALDIVRVVEEAVPCVGSGPSSEGRRTPGAPCGVSAIVLPCSSPAWWGLDDVDNASDFEVDARWLNSTVKVAVFAWLCHNLYAAPPSHRQPS